MYKAAQLIILNFAALLPAVPMVYRVTTAVSCRQGDVEYFDPNG